MENIFEIKNMNLTDMEETVELEEKTFSHSWSKESFESIILVEENLGVIARDKKSGVIAGYCIFTTSFEDADLCRIAVAKQWRRQHLADKLLEYSFEKLKKSGIQRILLEVRKNNYAAISLYKKYGFEQIGIRKGYYSEPLEDGLVFQLVSDETEI